MGGPALRLPDPPPLRLAEPNARGQRPWTTAEEQLLREHYPRGGSDAVHTVLPHRTRPSILVRAHRIGLRCLVRGPRAGRSRPRRWHPTDEIDAAIRQHVEDWPNRGTWGQLAQRAQRPAWWLRRRAVELALVVPRQEPVWSDEEIEILRRHSHQTVDGIQRALVRHGFNRSPSAIAMRRQRLKLGIRTNRKWFTAGQLAALLGLSDKTVGTWIRSGHLDARRRGTARTPQQGGDQWLIHRGAVREFVVRNPHSVDLRKVDRFWFIELLGGKP